MNQLASRLPKDLLLGSRSLIANVRSMEVAQKNARSTVGKLTTEQNDKLESLQELLGHVRSSAKQAFRGEHVKLREQFRIGGEKRHDLGFIIEEARLVHAACAHEENVAALSTKGWVQSDTERLADAITQLDTTDDVQETAKGSRVDATGEVTRNANELYDNLLAIQNAANIQWPASEASSAGIRGEFRLGTFPGHVASAKQHVDLTQTKTPPAPHQVQPVQTTTPPAATA
jgi:hypothetical protein